MSDMSAFKQIDDIIQLHGGWKGDMIQNLRDTVTAADLSIVEEVKWKTPSRPEGLPVWSHEGMICFVEIWKDNVKLIFTKGARLTDPHDLFNARLKSTDIRAIELHEGDPIDEAGIQALVLEAIELNALKANHPIN